MDGLKVERSGGIVTVTISNPATKNAMTNEMFDGFREICVEVSESPGDRVMIVTGYGDAFCSGADLKAGGIEGGGHLPALARMLRIHSGALALHNCSKPTIAAVNGVAAGAGLNLALGCDVVYASETARFTEIFVRRGLVVDYGGSWILPRLVGIQKAKELALSGEIVDAPEALRIGMVTRVFPSGELMPAARTLAEKIAAGPPIQTSIIKQNLDLGVSLPMEDVLRLEAESQAVALGTEDFVEAVMAWAQKREPEFKGR